MPELPRGLHTRLDGPNRRLFSLTGNRREGRKKESEAEKEMDPVLPLSFPHNQSCPGSAEYLPQHGRESPLRRGKKLSCAPPPPPLDSSIIRLTSRPTSRPPCSPSAPLTQKPKRAFPRSAADRSTSSSAAAAAAGTNLLPTPRLPRRAHTQTGLLPQRGEESQLRP